MGSTREKILKILAQKSNATINELAEAVGINAISVRHHITNLQAAGLVSAEEKRHGVGRPRLVYSLTESGMEHFSSRYFRLTTQLLAQLKDTLPENLIRELFQKMAEELADDYEIKSRDLSIEERLQLLKDILGKEGFEVTWQKQADHYEIREITCPYFKIGQNHPEVCTLDQTLISRVLNVPAEKVECILSGDQHCTYVVPYPQTETKK